MEGILKGLDEFVKVGKENKLVAILDMKSYKEIAIALHKNDFTSNQVSRLDNYLKVLHDRSKVQIPFHVKNCKEIFKIVENGKRNRADLISAKLWTMDAEQDFAKTFEHLKKTYGTWRELVKVNLLNCKKIKRLRKKVESVSSARVTVNEYLGGHVVKEKKRRLYQRSVEKEWANWKALMERLGFRKAF